MTVTVGKNCRDCRHCYIDDHACVVIDNEVAYTRSLTMCMAPQLLDHTCIVDGKQNAWEPCHAARCFNEVCGAEAKWFEPL